MSASSAAASLFSVTGKNVLVTGGSRGIGLMIAKGFAQHGANVLITSRDSQACQTASQDVGHGCQYVTSNLATREACATLAKQTHQLFDGRLDVLVNNAGCAWGEDPYYDHERESGKMNWGWDKVMDLNVKGLFYLTRECVPMLQRGRGGEEEESVDDPGRVINIGSVAGFIPQAAPTHAYDVSKAAVHHLTKKMACDLASRHITVNAVAPGYVLTRMSAGLGKWSSNSSDEEKQTNQPLGNIPLGRMGKEEDMMGACIYLSSRAGAYCTGVVLNVDGGIVGGMQIPLSNL